MSTPAAAPPTPATDTATRPLFGGYALVALVIAWLAGIALRQVGPLAGLGVPVWLGVALGAGGLWLVAGLLGHAMSGRRGRAAVIWRGVLIVGMLVCAAALGAARATAADPA